MPVLPAGFPATNAVDHFIADRIAKVSAEYAPLKKGGVDFFRDVKPILETHCYSCHQGAKVKGGLRLDTLAAALEGGKADGPAFVAGHPEDSPIVQRITSTDSEEIMPAKGDPLAPKDIETIKTWIREGAAWPAVQVASFELTPLADDSLSGTQPVLSSKVALETREVMEAVITEGTGKRLKNILLYPAFGKSGTAQLVNPKGGYFQDRYMSSFLLGAPFDRPELAILVTIEDPDKSKGVTGGGALAGPCAAEIMNEALEYLGVPHGGELAYGEKKPAAKNGIAAAN